MKAKLIHTLFFASFALPVVTWVLSSAAQAGLISVYKFDETTDNTAVDAIRPGTGDGTLSNFNGSQWVPGKFGNCVVFDGVDDYINALNTAPTGTTAFTISVWAYAETAAGWATIVKNWGHATVGSFHFGINGTANRPGNYLTNGTNTQAPSNLALQTWNHLAVTYNGPTNTQKLYINGVLVATSTAAPASLTALGTRMGIGAKLRDDQTLPALPANVPGFWKGKLDDLAFWDETLTDQQILEIRNNGEMGVGVLDPQVTSLAKAGTSTDLNATASWTGGNVPASNNIALWNGTSLGAGLTLDAAASWRGISIGGAASDIAISGTGNLTLGASGIDMAAATVNLSMSQPVTLGAGQVWTVNNGRTLTASGGISGAFGLTKGGAGGLALTNASLYAGATTITAGTLELGDGTSGHDNTLATSAISVGGIGTLKYNLAGDQTVGYPITGAQGATLEKAGPGLLTLNNTGAVNFGADGSTLNVTGGTLRYTGLANDTGLYQKTLRIGQDATLEMNVDTGVRNAFGAWTGSYEGDGTLEKTGGGTLSFGLYGAGPRSVNFLPGAVIRLTEGMLRSSDGWERVNWTNNKASLALAQDATFDMNGDTVFVDALTGSGTVQTSSGSPVLTLGVADGGGSFDGVIQGTIGITKTGDGTQVLSGGNTYSGNTTINAGTLTLAAGGQLSFVLGATSGANNRVSVTEDGIAIINGNFSIDTTAADGLPGGTWILLDAATPADSFGVSFQVVSGFSPDGSTKWTKSLGGSGKVYTFDEETGILTLSGGTDFASWAATNAVGQTMGQDHDNDGVGNGIEYFMGLSGSGFTATPAIATNLAISWPKGASYTGTYGTHYVIETSADLSIWDPVPETAVTIDADSVDYTLPTTGPKGFARLKVTGP
jgi:autotransporter-associated beta strand protein